MELPQTQYSSGNKVIQGALGSGAADEAATSGVLTVGGCGRSSIANFRGSARHPWSHVCRILKLSVMA